MHFEHNYHILPPSPREICQKQNQIQLSSFKSPLKKKPTEDEFPSVEQKFCLEQKREEKLR